MPPATPSPWRETTGGVLLRVRLAPKSSRDAIEGVEATVDGPALKVRVRAVPEDGKANAALVALVADWLDVTGKSVTLASGAKSRIKTVAIAGSAATLVAALCQRIDRRSV